MNQKYRFNDNNADKYHLYNMNEDKYLSSSSSSTMTTTTLIQLQRGRPMFAEIDFIPRYIPEFTSHVSITVTLPSHIRGRPWILGFHQEQFYVPICRLCTNINKSYTLPVTIFLPDDGWCSEGRVQTIWKIEALQLLNSINKQQQQQQQQLQLQQEQQQMDQTDMILAYGYDELKQIFIKNNINSTRCQNIHEEIIA